jgi:hypothetical protein
VYEPVKCLIFESAILVASSESSLALIACRSVSIAVLPAAVVTANKRGDDDDRCLLMSLGAVLQRDEHERRRMDEAMVSR